MSWAPKILVAVAAIVIASVLYDNNNPESVGFEWTRPPAADAVHDKSWVRTTEHFTSRGSQIEAWVYRPTNTAQPPPLVIMAPPLGLQKDFGMEKFASRFASRGLAVLLFDYRFFGGSEGEPRHFVSTSRQQEDWHAAIRYAGNVTSPSLEGVNPGKIALWGAGLSGGHLIAVAADQANVKNENISAIVLQAPQVDGFATVMHGLQGPHVRSSRDALLLAVLGIKDLVLSFFGRNHYIPLASSSKLAIMHTAESDQYPSLAPSTPRGGWVNKVPARTGVELIFYRPILKADQMPLPALVVYGEDDSLSPASAVERAASYMKHAELVKRPGGHISALFGKEADQVAEIEADFLVKHLLASNQ